MTGSVLAVVNEQEGLTDWYYLYYFLDSSASQMNRKLLAPLNNFLASADKFLPHRSSTHATNSTNEFKVQQHLTRPFNVRDVHGFSPAIPNPV